MVTQFEAFTIETPKRLSSVHPILEDDQTGAGREHHVHRIVEMTEHEIIHLATLRLEKRKAIQRFIGTTEMIWFVGAPVGIGPA